MIPQKVILSPDALLKLLDKYELDIFTSRSFAERTTLKLADWRQQLRTLIKYGLIDIIERGKYCRHNFRNEYVIGNFLAEDGVIAYWTALNLHGLTEQFPNTIFVQTARQKKTATVFGVTYKFVKVKSAKMVGIERQGYGNNQFRITDKEKTVVDCFDLPDYSGGFEELIRAFVRTGLDAAKLITYCGAVDNISAIKRMGYLAELFKKESTAHFIAYALTKVNERFLTLQVWMKERILAGGNSG
ncbi:MAG TPA: type IV toxin-antitoxin system AbiEi family antitoxin [Niabella sp.]|nr:type IV toxin-antitoxin system AbiEi family antitoxin [Niabella sp.]